MTITSRMLLVLRECGFPEPTNPITSGGFYRWGKNYSCFLMPLGEVGFCFGDWRRNFKKTYYFKHPDSLPKQERQAIRRQLKEVQRQIDEEHQVKHRDAASKAARMLKRAPLLNGIHSHPYLTIKNVAAHGIYLVWGNILAIPMRDVEGRLWNIQRIKTDGAKYFLPGGRKKGCFFVIGNLANADRFYICEGYATGATIYEATGVPVVVAFDAGNLEAVLALLIPKYPDHKPIIAADNDAYGDTNTGIEAARKAAAKFRCSYVFPSFPERNMS